jgi:hypothetical protein
MHYLFVITIFWSFLMTNVLPLQDVKHADFTKLKHMPFNAPGIIIQQCVIKIKALALILSFVSITALAIDTNVTIVNNTDSDLKLHPVDSEYFTCTGFNLCAAKDSPIYDKIIPAHQTVQFQARQQTTVFHKADSQFKFSLNNANVGLWVSTNKVNYRNPYNLQISNDGFLYERSRVTYNSYTPDYYMYVGTDTLSIKASIRDNKNEYPVHPTTYRLEATYNVD